MRHEAAQVFQSGHSASNEARQSVCADVEIFAEFRATDGDWGKVRIENLSTTGFRIGWVPERSLRQRFWIRFAGLAPMSAVVRYRGGNETGCQFTIPLSRYVYEHIVGGA